MSDDDYPGGWFGESWGAPVCDPERHKETPVGESCMGCQNGIREGDQGSAIPDASTGRLSYIHRDCLMRWILPGGMCKECRGLNVHKSWCSRGD